MHVAAVAEGHYQVGEIRRLQGDLVGAEEAYQRAHRLGRDPQPGLALLRLAQGRADAASASICAALVAKAHDQLACSRLCAAQVEIALATGDTEAAEAACDELTEIASTYGSSGLEAAALHARGAVALAEGRPEEALPCCAPPASAGRS
jgi:tetratricopeptide (TPR) repeat protein